MFLHLVVFPHTQQQSCHWISLRPDSNHLVFYHSYFHGMYDYPEDLMRGKWCFDRIYLDLTINFVRQSFWAACIKWKKATWHINIFGFQQQLVISFLNRYKCRNLPVMTSWEIDQINFEWWALIYKQTRGRLTPELFIKSCGILNIIYTWIWRAQWTWTGAGHAWARPKKYLFCFNNNISILCKN